MDAAAPSRNTTGPDILFAEPFRFWLKLDFISFGGPAGQIAVTHQELLERDAGFRSGVFCTRLTPACCCPGQKPSNLPLISDGSCTRRGAQDPAHQHRAHGC